MRYTNIYICLQKYDVMIDVSYFTDTRCIWYCYRYFSLYVNDKLMPVKYIFGGIFIHKTRTGTQYTEQYSIHVYTEAVHDF